MRKRIAIVTAGVLAIPVVALAAPAPKVFVCKYVGTPGTNERLQTGNNPISVSSNAIPNYQGVGSYFADAHGRSYVLAEDTGQPEPNVSECPVPTPDNPPPTPTPSPTPSPTPNPVTPPAQTPQAPAATPVEDEPQQIIFGK